MPLDDAAAPPNAEEHRLDALLATDFNERDEFISDGRFGLHLERVGPRPGLRRSFRAGW
jgi:hypothetical protein